jgi:hypothetical protein
MVEFLIALGSCGVAGALIGVLVGIGAVWWVEPTTKGGTALLMAISTILVAVLAFLLCVIKKPSTSKEQTVPKEEH